MKRRTFIKRAGLFIPFAPAILQAQIMPGSRRAASVLPATSGSYVLKDSQASTNHTNPLGYTSSKTYIAGAFEAGSSYTLKRVEVEVYRVGSASSTITCHVYDDSSGPSGTRATSSDTITHSALTDAAGTFEEWNFAGKSISSGTKYWIALQISADSTTNHALIRINAFTTGYTTQYSNNGSSWGLESNNAKIAFKTYAVE